VGVIEHENFIACTRTTFSSHLPDQSIRRVGKVKLRSPRKLYSLSYKIPSYFHARFRAHYVFQLIAKIVICQVPIFSRVALSFRIYFENCQIIDFRESGLEREKNRAAIDLRYISRRQPSHRYPGLSCVKAVGFGKSRSIRERRHDARRGAPSAAEAPRARPRCPERGRGASREQATRSEQRGGFPLRIRCKRRSRARARLCVSELAFYAVKCPPSIIWTCVGCVS